jgi:hypothetical protein
MTIGRRFGERFILDFQLTAAGHEMPDLDTSMIGSWILLNGTVLFREREIFQPFLRGGFGAGGWGLDYPDDQGFLMSFGTSAMTGAGFMVALSSRFSLEVEGAALFVNHLEVRNDENEEDENWKVRVSSQSWRVGMGLSVWF